MLSLPLETLQQAKSAFEDRNYAQAAWLYEQLLELEPEQISHAWYLGLARLLMGQEAEAQFTWMMALSAAEPEQIEPWTAELVEVLSTAAEQQTTVEAWQLVWAIRQHLREIDPTEINNLLHQLSLAARLNLLDLEYLQSLGLIELLQSQSIASLDSSFVLESIVEALDSQFGNVQMREPLQQLTEAALSQIEDRATILSVVAPKAHEFRERARFYDFDLATYLAEIALRYNPDDSELWKLLSACHEIMGRYPEAIAAARSYLAASKTPDEQMAAMGFLCVRLLRTGSSWQEVQDLFKQQQALLPKLLETYTPNPTQPIQSTLLTFCSFYLYYLSDNPVEHRQLQNQLAALVQTDLQFQAQSVFAGSQQRSRPTIQNRKLKIGYIARYMQQHPVGWLARWLMQYHDQEQFEIYTYHLHVKELKEFTGRWFVQPVTRSARFDDGSWAGIAKHICENDEIDILIDLDSITYSETCSVLALKPAPIQISWLGFDATGIPAVDYFIADPYVLPDSAQAYYTEKIWRLPSTYLAVDGFEIGVPTLRRDQLGIPSDAVIYLSAQDGRKRHPEMIRLQLSILREVPNSHLLLKGLGDQASLRQAFEEAAEAEDVSLDRLHFLPRDFDELTHRANLGIADVVLDTYPYNGATTTLETLWMGIPVVTRVGQQWAARNSYTMLKNVGVDEGIAWTDAEYLEWGIRLGKDAALRQDIRMRLLQSRQSSPLWNTRLFAKEMEQAYQQMWKRYCDE